MRRFWGLATTGFAASLVVVFATTAFPRESAQGPYFSLRQLATDRGLDFVWDPVARNATLSGPLGFARFHAGSEYFLSEGRLQRLPEKVLFSGGEVLAPREALTTLKGLSKPLRVMIDPGHGGRDFGAITGASREKEITLQVARDLASELKANGVRVRLTRNSDSALTLADRVSLVNRSRPDLFVSVHANASATRSLEGFEVYYLSPETDDYLLADGRADKPIPGEEAFLWSGASRQTRAIYWDLRQADNRRQSLRLAKEVVESVRQAIGSGSPFRIRGARFYVLKWTECPAVLVEIGYLTNRREEKKLKHSVYRKKLIKAVAEGLINYAYERKTDRNF
ncbi:MAG: N-acetylmuramoyl-L-alanine amidase [Candidatus Omnitrophica bacterium]|nr:N-acetylmuramoyl-L-alanine amidase [Candidatus Omnitrophota bacterium]